MPRMLVQVQELFAELPALRHNSRSEHGGAERVHVSQKVTGSTNADEVMVDAVMVDAVMVDTSGDERPDTLYEQAAAALK